MSIPDTTMLAHRLVVLESRVAKLELARPDARSRECANTRPAAADAVTSAPLGTAGTNPAASTDDLNKYVECEHGVLIAEGVWCATCGKGPMPDTFGKSICQQCKRGGYNHEPTCPTKKAPSSPPCLDWKDGSTHCDLPRGHDGVHSWELPPQHGNMRDCLKCNCRYDAHLEHICLTQSAEVLSREDWRRLMFEHPNSDAYGKLADHDSALRAEVKRLRGALEELSINSNDPCARFECDHINAHACVTHLDNEICGIATIARQALEGGGEP